MLPILTETQRQELIAESQGRAISFIDSPEWYCGNRKSTHMSRDDTPESTTVEYMGGGTCVSLAYSMYDHVMDYRRQLDSIEYCTRLNAQLEAEYVTEEKRKTPRKRRLAEIGRQHHITRQDLNNARRRRDELVAKYFRGYVKRLLIETETETTTPETRS